MNDWRSTALWKNERLLHVAVDLEQVAAHFPDLWKENIETLMIDLRLEPRHIWGRFVSVDASEKRSEPTGVPGPGWTSNKT